MLLQQIQICLLGATLLLSPITQSFSFKKIKNLDLIQNFIKPKPDYWSWETINTRNIVFPHNFMWGVNTAAYLIEGGCINNQFFPHEDKNKPSLKACDHFNRYKEDIQLIKQHGMNTFLFSVEWSKVEPQQDFFDTTVLDHYAHVLDELIANNITPIIVLHRYTHPLWFEQKGGFEFEENIDHFVTFAHKVFAHLGQKKAFWITFYNPASYAAKAYLRGTIPPFNKPVELSNTRFFSMRSIKRKLVNPIERTINVIENMFKAHDTIYFMFKNMLGGKNARIGITKQVYPLEAWNRFNPADRLAATVANKIVNDTVYNYFTTCSLKITIPFIARKDERISNRAYNSLDFIGVNYHSHGYMQNFKAVSHPDEPKTESDIFTMYPEGLYQAIKNVSDNIAKPLNIPIIVTQNSIMTTDDKLRQEFYQKHVYTVAQARKNGYNVIGYMTDLFDHHAWGKDKIDHIGLFAVDPNSMKRSLKTGSQQFINFVKKQNQN